MNVSAKSALEKGIRSRTRANMMNNRGSFRVNPQKILFTLHEASAHGASAPTAGAAPLQGWVPMKV